MSSKDSGPKKFKDMSVIQLKEYLQDRGVSVSGYLKPAFVEIATAVNKMMLPFRYNFEDKETFDNDHFYINENRKPIYVFEQCGEQLCGLFAVGVV